MVFAVLTQVIGEFVDPLGQQRDLDLGGAGVAISSGRTCRSARLFSLWSGSSRKKRGSGWKLAQTPLCVLDVGVHLGDQLLDAGKAPSPRRRSTKATRRVWP